VPKVRLKPEPELTLAFEQEKREIRRLFFRKTAESFVILIAIFAEALLVLLWSYLLILAVLLGIYFLVPAAITSIFGESRFFSRKHALAFYGWYFRAWGLASVVAIVLSLAFPFRGPILLAPDSLWSGLLLLISLSGLSFWTIFQAFRTFNRVDVALPKYAMLGGLRGGSWAVYNLKLMQECDGMTVAVKNHSNSPLVLTMVWLEWFAKVGVPTAFHREMRIVDSYSRTYYREVIDLDRIIIIKPKAALAWTLEWDQVSKFYRELLSRKLVDRRFVVSFRISVYDEYTDRISDSQKVSVQTILAQAYYVKHGRQIDRRMRHYAKIWEPLLSYLNGAARRK
jgi:hypothetical protein